MPDHKDQLFETQLGQSADVFRETVRGEHADHINNKLLEIGRNANPLPKHLKHMGSAAVHIFYNETLKQFYAVSQTAPLKGCPEKLAIAAARDLTGALMEHYGHKRPTKRSGF